MWPSAFLVVIDQRKSLAQSISSGMAGPTMRVAIRPLRAKRAPPTCILVTRHLLPRNLVNLAFFMFSCCFPELWPCAWQRPGLAKRLLYCAEASFQQRRPREASCFCYMPCAGLCFNAAARHCQPAWAARVRVVVDWFIGQLVNVLVGQLDGWLMYWLVDWLIDVLVG